MAIKLEYNDSPPALFVIENESEETASHSKPENLSTTKKNDFNIKDNIFGNSKHRDIYNEFEYNCTKKEKLVDQTINNIQRNGSRRRKTDSKKYNSVLLLCTMCEYQASSKHNMATHMDIHLGIQTYKCTHCNYKATDEAIVRDHEVANHTGDAPFRCEVCLFRAHKQFILEKHMKSHRPETCEKQFSCPKCDANFNERRALKLHFTIHTGEKNYACDVCDYKTRDRSNLARHKRKHEDRKASICPVCDKQIIDKKTFEDHVQGHNGIYPFVCKENNCNFKTTSAVSLRIHVAKSHSTKYSCDLCDFKCGYKCTLKIHYRIHTGEKPFSCPECSYTTRIGTYLKTHMLRHDGSHSYLCDQCEYSCKRKGSLQQHILVVHSSEKPYSCSSCDFVTKTKLNIKRHLLSKHNEKQ